MLESYGPRVRGEQPACSPEERAAAENGLDRQSEAVEQSGCALQPGISVCDRAAWVTDENELVHSKGLHSCRVETRFMPKTLAVDLESAPTWSEPSTTGGIQRVTRCWTERDVGALEELCPVSPTLQAAKYLCMQVVVTLKSIDRSNEIREGPHEV